jgi:hypothetical protein
MLAQFADDLTVDHLPIAVERARLPELIGGYGHVNERALEKVVPRWSVLKQAYDEAGSWT